MTSVEGDTQWLVGTIVGGGAEDAPPSFTPETGGNSDQGVDYYAAKTGGPTVLSPDSRRLLFAFNGWGGGVTSGPCGRYDIIPRELTLRDGFLHIAPIAEIVTIRKNTTTTQHNGPATRTLIRSGNQLDLRLNCTLNSATVGNVSLDVLSSADGKQFARYGFDLSTSTFYIASQGLKTTTSKPQRPYTMQPQWISMTVLVDGGVCESFTDSSVSMATSPRQDPFPNGAVTTRSFLPSATPFHLNGGGRGVFLTVPAGVGCSLLAADLKL